MRRVDTDDDDDGDDVDRNGCADSRFVSSPFFVTIWVCFVVVTVARDSVAVLFFFNPKTPVEDLK